jgi:magnesium transporter
MLLLDVDRPVVQDFAQHLKASLKREDESVYFEFRILEFILQFVCAKYQRRMSCFHPVVNVLLREMNSEEITITELRRLLPLKNSLAALERATHELVDVIQSILRNDEDMLEMFITEKALRGWQLPPKEVHAEVELLLENYHREISTLSQEATYLRKNLQAGQDMMNLGLDTYRNRMMRIQMQMGIAAVGIAGGTVLTSMFGMNLQSGLEHIPYSFPIICVSSVALIVGMHNSITQWTRPSRKNIDMANDMTQVFSVMRKMGDIQDIVLLSLHDQHNTKMGKQEFRQLLEKACGKSVQVSDEDMNLIYRVFDKNQDGLLSLEEIKKFLADQHSTQYIADTRESNGIVPAAEPVTPPAPTGTSTTVGNVGSGG